MTSPRSKRYRRRPPLGEPHRQHYSTEVPQHFSTMSTPLGRRPLIFKESFRIYYMFSYLLDILNRWHLVFRN